MPKVRRRRSNLGKEEREQRRRGREEPVAERQEKEHRHHASNEKEGGAKKEGQGGAAARRRAAVQLRCSKPVAAGLHRAYARMMTSTLPLTLHALDLPYLASPRRRPLYTSSSNGELPPQLPCLPLFPCVAGRRAEEPAAQQP